MVLRHGIALWYLSMVALVTSYFLPSFPLLIWSVDGTGVWRAIGAYQLERMGGGVGESVTRGKTSLKK